MENLSRSDELEAFKTQIDLAAYIESRGYARDPRQSSLRYTVLRSASGEKINVSRGANRHWRYVNVHDAQDAGTIIDFVQVRDRCSLGEVRKLLRNWLGRVPSSQPAAETKQLPMISAGPDRERVRRAWNESEPITDEGHYLVETRGIALDLIASPLFRGRILTEQRHGNALFAHFDSGGLCGYEAKNHGITGFSPGGAKGLFCSRPRPDDRELIVCETAIDALSYAMLFGTENRIFVSTAGQVSETQIWLLQKAASKLPEDCRVVLAVDNDDGGHRLEAVIRPALKEVGTPEASIRTHVPQTTGDDWNAILLQSQPRITPAPAPQPVR